MVDSSAGGFSSGTVAVHSARLQCALRSQARGAFPSRERLPIVAACTQLQQRRLCAPGRQLPAAQRRAGPSRAGLAVGACLCVVIAYVDGGNNMSHASMCGVWQHAMRAPAGSHVGTATWAARHIDIAQGRAAPICAARGRMQSKCRFGCGFRHVGFSFRGVPVCNMATCFFLTLTPLVLLRLRTCSVLYHPCAPGWWHSLSAAATSGHACSAWGLTCRYTTWYYECTMSAPCIEQQAERRPPAQRGCSLLR